MAVPQSFRSAFNGFNREDVVHYIEYINSKHNTEVNQLRADLEAMQNQLNAVSDTSDLAEELESLRQERDTLLETVAQLEARVTAPSEKEMALEVRCAELEAALQAAKSVQPAQQMAFELEAYRRAERTERIARERAEQIYHQTNSTLAEATVKVDTAAADIAHVADVVLSHLSTLHATVTGSKTLLNEARDTMYAICPKSDAE